MRLMRFFFHLLYHPFAFAYDAVAWVVSFGRWRQWGAVTLQYLAGRTVLELGSGPGHLQAALSALGKVAYALEESPHMLRLATRRLQRIGVQPRLTRGVSQHLPFPADYFDHIVSTFPSEYIFHPDTLHETLRVLRPGGTLIVIPMAWHTGSGFPFNALRWLFRITGQGAEITDAIQARLRQPFEQASFVVNTHIVTVGPSKVLALVACKTG